jgi:hypothetical protein
LHQRLANRYRSCSPHRPGDELPVKRPSD